MTSCLTKSSEKSKNSLIRGGGFINPVFQNLKIFLNKGGGLFTRGFLFFDPVYYYSPMQGTFFFNRK